MLHIAAKEGKNEILQLLLVNNGYVNNMDATENRQVHQYNETVMLT